MHFPRHLLIAGLGAIVVGCTAGQVDDTTGPDTTPVDTTGNAVPRNEASE